jgi:ABC-type polysaccharide/polyol phosphate transport system ATPase subunit
VQNSSISSENTVIRAVGISVEYLMVNAHGRTIKETLINSFKKKSEVPKKLALENVSLYAKRGECIALVGHNGCGKSTFLKCVAGIIEPTTGSIETKGRIAPMIELGAGFDPEMTGRENVFLSCSLMGLSTAEIRAKINDIEAFAELKEYFDAPVKTYSSGMYMRLGFACTLAIDADIMLIDEILAVGDINFQRKCLKNLERIRENGATLILVTHDINVVKSMADRVYVFDQGHLVFEGKAHAAAEHYEELMAKKEFEALPKGEQEEILRLKKLRESDAIAPRGQIARILSADVQEKLEDGESSGNYDLVINFEVLEALTAPPVVGFAINFARDDRRVFGGNSRTFERFIEPLDVLKKIKDPGKYRLRFSFERPPLASGAYNLVVAIHSADLDRTLDFKKFEQAFEVSLKDDLQNFDMDIISPNLFMAQSSLSALN